MAKSMIIQLPQPHDLGEFVIPPKNKVRAGDKVVHREHGYVKIAKILNRTQGVSKLLLNDQVPICPEGETIPKWVPITELQMPQAVAG